MKNKYSLLFLFAAFCCLGVQCKEEEPDKIDELAKLPPATTKGRNTFGCLINGKAFPYGAPGEHIKLAYYDNGEFYVSYKTRLNPFSPVIESGVTLFVTNKITSEGTFFINPIDDQDHFTVIWNDKFFASKYSLKPEDKIAKIVITRFDTINHVLSGNFSFKAKTIQGEEEVVIEHGRFDFQY